MNESGNIQDTKLQIGGAQPETMPLPASTGWPLVMSLGLTLVGLSLVTHFWLIWVGALLFVVGALGWFRNVLPHEAHENVLVDETTHPSGTSYENASRVAVDHTHRAQLPMETFPISSGIKGGIAGGISMVIPAEIYGIIRYHSVWYVVNLLGGAGVGAWNNPTVAQLSSFHLGAFLIANVIQGATTLLVGILYGALLPIWPRRPILLGGILAPIIWTGLLYSIIGLINPYFANHIDWWSFAASQVFFGVVAGYVVSKSGRLTRLQQVPLSERLGLETADLPSEHGSEDNRR